MKLRLQLFAAMAMASASFAKEPHRKAPLGPDTPDKERINHEVLFQRLDKDGNKLLNFDEFKILPIFQNDPAKAERIFNALDMNHDKSLGLREFSKFAPPPPGGGDHPEPEAIFKKLDTDGNGTLSLAEFKASPLGQRAGEKAEEFFKRLDANGDGSLTLEEFLKHFKPPGDRPPGPEVIFKKLDTDGSGGLSLEEFKGMPVAQRDPVQAEEIFNRLDTDGDGSLTLDEFRKHFVPKDGGDRPDAEAIFKKLDGDNSGTLSLEEFKTSPLGVRAGDKAGEIFNHLDADGDGSLTLDEFRKHFPVARKANDNPQRKLEGVE